MSINGLLGFWELMTNEGNFTFVPMSRLNQDCIENLFCVIRGKGGFRDNPDIEEFKDAFMFIVINKFFISKQCQQLQG